MNLESVLAMGGYGLFVWPAYCITLTAFTVNFVGAWRERRRVINSLQQTWAQTTR